MRIALVGYGKMGKEIERLANERGWSIDVRVDIDTPSVTKAQRENVDVVIHFATAKDIISDLTPWAEAHKPIVIGTTGWQNQLQNIEALVIKNQIGLIYASNFSLGVNIYYHLVKTAAQMMDKFADYDQEFCRENTLACYPNARDPRPDWPHLPGGCSCRDSGRQQSFSAGTGQGA